MPRVPYYGGNITSAAMTNPVAPAKSLLQTVGETGVGMVLGSGFADLFKDPATDPKVQQARYFATQADAEQQKIEAARKAGEAQQTLGRDAGIVRAFRQPDTPLDKTAEAIAGAAQRALAAGADAKQVMAQVNTFALSLPGDAADQLGVRIQAILGGNYIKENESPSLARQDFVREDAQAATSKIEDGKLAMQKYGFDTKAATDRIDIATDAKTAVRGQDVSAGTARRGQDLTNQRAIEAQRRVADLAAQPTETVKTTTLDKGDKGSQPGALARAFGAQPKPARAPSKTEKTVTRRTAPNRVRFDAQGNVIK